MSNLFILNEIITNNFNYNVLNIISVIAILCGILVIISKNPIVSVLFLIGLFISIAGYLMMLGINFIGLSYLLVYVGAVSILFLFILMLINVRISELITDNSNSIPLAVMIIIFVNINQLFPRAVSMPIMMIGGFDLVKKNYVDLKGEIQPYLDFDSSYTQIGSDVNELFFVTSPAWDLKLAENFHITTIGNVIYTNYPIWLILTSIILLLAMIGSILITIKQ
jgi:NADH-ubiquinone oxidoreductase chain 6